MLPFVHFIKGRKEILNIQSSAIFSEVLLQKNVLMYIWFINVFIGNTVNKLLLFSSFQGNRPKPKYISLYIHVFQGKDLF